MKEELFQIIGNIAINVRDLMQRRPDSRQTIQDYSNPQVWKWIMLVDQKKIKQYLQAIGWVEDGSPLDEITNLEAYVEMVVVDTLCQLYGYKTTAELAKADGVVV